MEGQHLLGKIGPIARLPVAPGDQARTYLKGVLDELGCPYESVPFSSVLRLPVAWRVQVQDLTPGSGWCTVPSAAAVGSPTCREVEGRVTSAGTGAPMEYQLGGESYRGSIVLAALGALLSRQGIHVFEWGLWVQPELLNVIMLKLSLIPGEARNGLSQARDAALRLAQDMGGSMESCHGVGLRLSHLMGEEHGRGLDLMRQVKAALDPHNIMNPGKMGL